MASTAYHLRQAAGCLRQTPYATLMAVSALAVALSLAGGTYLLARAATDGLKAYAAQASITVFLPDELDAPGEDLATIAANVAAPGALAEFVPPEVALARLRDDLGDLGSALDALADNPLPQTIEVRLAPAWLAREGIEGIHAATGRLAGLPFAEEVDDGRSFVERLEAFLSWIRRAGVVVLVGVLAVALFFVGSVVRLTVYARREEIEVLRLVGATDLFIAVPFVLEGLIQGLAGGLAAALLLAVSERLVLPPLVAELGFGAQLLPPPLGMGVLILFVLAGAALGMIASFLAAFRFIRSLG